LLEREVAPAFYDRDETGVPRGWLARMRRSMAVLTPQFSATRMVRDYVEQAYLPAAAALRERMQDGAAKAKAMAQWEQRARGLARRAHGPVDYHPRR
jgi:starch phosphorylase